MPTRRRIRVDPEASYIADDFLRHISHVFRLHTNQSVPQKSVRHFDGRTPYAVHPVSCALAILQEETLPWKLRLLGAHVLLYQDIFEDTNARAPSTLSSETIRYIRKMTFENIDDEIDTVWSRGSRTLLFKLYDKANTLLDIGTADPVLVKKYAEYTLRLTEKVEKAYGELNVVVCARALAYARIS